MSVGPSYVVITPISASKDFQAKIWNGNGQIETVNILTQHRPVIQIPVQTQDRIREKWCSIACPRPQPPPTSQSSSTMVVSTASSTTINRRPTQQLYRPPSARNSSTKGSRTEGTRTRSTDSYNTMPGLLKNAISMCQKRQTNFQVVQKAMQVRPIGFFFLIC